MLRASPTSRLDPQMVPGWPSGALDPTDTTHRGGRAQGHWAGEDAVRPLQPGPAAGQEAPGWPLRASFSFSFAAAAAAAPPLPALACARTSCPPELGSAGFLGFVGQGYWQNHPAPKALRPRIAPPSGLPCPAAGRPPAGVRQAPGAERQEGKEGETETQRQRERRKQRKNLGLQERNRSSALLTGGEQRRREGGVWVSLPCLV